MSYRDDLNAALLRVSALDAEIARMKAAPTFILAPETCHYCGSGKGGWHDFAKGRCEEHGSGIGHRHYGIHTRGCGTLGPWWRRLLRLCFRRKPHFHVRCDNCNTKWTENATSTFANKPC